MKFLITYDVAFSHTHMSVWVKPPGAPVYAHSGKLVLRNEEFAVFRPMLEKGGVQFEERV